MAGAQPFAVSIGIFRQPQQTSPISSEEPGNVYFVVALTTLNVETGILNFFSYQEGGERNEVLEAGDGIVCLGENVRRRGGGQGGIAIIIRYQTETGR